ncbi:hypothetical protein PDIG_24100 [Penicillium digitatum PHI26]|uniref:Uncharacterized protein n=2 Tax=Penicillium digitatum TaxID=36651 RepID=K9GRK2_PEND2|nr:hypothetical protein PDIP_58600 [Penicillium digitatum Pd1]EKV10728.1 hypothetical protein PDIP_58600 [Penicillium digitatum Pd1]EKV15741.1 hypothetical protein PDIG_24100 [Penicillium digitatum PHI26]
MGELGWHSCNIADCGTSGCSLIAHFYHVCCF